MVESIITEDYSVNKLEETVAPLTETITSKIDAELPLVDKITPQAKRWLQSLKCETASINGTGE